MAETITVALFDVPPPRTVDVEEFLSRPTSPVQVPIFRPPLSAFRGVRPSTPEPSGGPEAPDDSPMGDDRDGRAFEVVPQRPSSARPLSARPLSARRPLSATSAGGRKRPTSGRPTPVYNKAATWLEQLPLGQNVPESLLQQLAQFHAQQQQPPPQQQRPQSPARQAPNERKEALLHGRGMRLTPRKPMHVWPTIAASRAATRKSQTQVHAWKHPAPPRKPKALVEDPRKPKVFVEDAWGGDDGDDASTCVPDCFSRQTSNDFSRQTSPAESAFGGRRFSDGFSRQSTPTENVPATPPRRPRSGSRQSVFVSTTASMERRRSQKRSEDDVADGPTAKRWG
eukprot:TRINITY_DN4530_c0_g1_i1.p1 TRINITY_DN4530_c0_g1~~TRINITY_DN4530_c0_g1_i1.p1  ORF type:complete len:340 (-),score=60.70 TRINITY_DN4530_c0_g1_i1:63-1082(-)